MNLGKEYRLAGLAYYALIFRAYCHLMSGEARLAEKDVSELNLIAEESRLPLTTYVQKARALLASLTGHVADALQFGHAAVAIADSDGPAYMRHLVRADMAPIAIQAGDLPQALRWVEEGETLDAASIMKLNYAQHAMARAYLAWAQNDLIAMEGHLARALKLARMTGMHGELSRSRPALPILFTHALAQGIETDLVKELIRKWRIASPSPWSQVWPWPVKIYALGPFKILLNDEELSSKGRSHYRVLELLKALVVSGPAPVGNGDLIDWLWPDSEGDAAAINLRTTVHRLRQLLGIEQAVVMQDNKVSLNQDRCWVDAWSFEALVDLCGIDIGHAENSTRSTSDLEQALDLYAGPLLGREAYAWMLSARERLRARFFRALVWLGNFYEERQEWDAAVAAYRKGLEIHDDAELLYQRIMLCLKAQGRVGEALSVFQQCRKSLARTGTGGPSRELQAVYESLRRAEHSHA